MAIDAGPPELLINPFTCLQLISSLVSLNLRSAGLKPSHVWTLQLEEQFLSRLIGVFIEFELGFFHLKSKDSRQIE